MVTEVVDIINGNGVIKTSEDIKSKDISTKGNIAIIIVIKTVLQVVVPRSEVTLVFRGVWPLKCLCTRGDARILEFVPPSDTVEFLLLIG